MGVTKIAIACQGGGSQTAFTAGAAKALIEHQEAGKEFETVGISGTSGGAVCAALVWSVLTARSDDDVVHDAGQPQEFH
jgi:NTE family protein